ncbi:MAG: hypothetical protein IAE89_10340 [Anaerolineae bacterium]|nr:hypothetical protein [Anaerolineae bacterium]
MALPELTRTRVSVETFEQIAQLPENRDKKLECHTGEVVEVVSNDRLSQLAARCLILLGVYVQAHHLGWFTGADGGHIINGERYGFHVVCPLRKTIRQGVESSRARPRG